jgi:hypothetical protein
MYSKYSALCALLVDMAAQWWFAGAMARVGRKALETVDRREAVEGLGMLAHNTTSLNHIPNVEIDEQGKDPHGLTYGDGSEGMDEFLTLFPDLAAPVGWDNFVVGTELEASDWWLDPLGNRPPEELDAQRFHP